MWRMLFVNQNCPPLLLSLSRSVNVGSVDRRDSFDVPTLSGHVVAQIEDLFAAKLYLFHSWHVSVPRLSALKHWSTYLLSWGASSQRWSIGFICWKRKTNSGEGDDLYLLCQWEIRLTLLFFVYVGNSASTLRVIRSVRASVLADRRSEWWQQGECVRARFLSVIYMSSSKKKEKKTCMVRGKARKSRQG